MTGDAWYLLGTVILTGLLTLGGVQAVILSIVDRRAAISPDEQDVARHSFWQGCSRLVADVLLFGLVLLFFISSEHRPLALWLRDHRPIWYTAFPTAVSCLAAGHAIELPWRRRFIATYGRGHQQATISAGEDVVVGVNATLTFEELANRLGRGLTVEDVRLALAAPL